MKKIITVLLLTLVMSATCFAQQPAQPKTFDKKFFTVTALAGAATSADAYTTAYCLQNVALCHETNPFFGKNPSNIRIAAIKSASFGITTGFSIYLKHKHYKYWWVPQVAQIGVSGLAAALNARHL